jgi:hypothetical protein
LSTASAFNAGTLVLLATKLRTLHLTLALEAGNQTGQNPVTAELVESVLSHQLDDLKPTLTRHGYKLKDIVEQFDATPAEIQALFSNQLELARAADCAIKYWRRDYRSECLHLQIK